VRREKETLQEDIHAKQPFARERNTIFLYFREIALGRE
jgi:hypothetical protein